MRLLFLTILLLPLAAFAGDNPDEGLYDPVPPKGSAFIRFINASQEKSFFSINKKLYGELEPGKVSSYFVVKSKNAKLLIGKAEHNFKPEPGRFYTAVLKEKIYVLEDDKNKNSAKAMILFYNLSSENPLSLKTSDGNVEIVPQTEINNVASKQINPVKVKLAIFNKDKKIKDMEPLAMERGMVYSAILTDSGATWVRGTTDTTR